MANIERASSCNWSGIGRCKRPLGHEGAHQILLNDAETAHLLDVGMGWDRQREIASHQGSSPGPHDPSQDGGPGH